MTRVLLAGAPTGCWTNLGDEAILAGMLDGLRAAISDLSITVVTSSPAGTYEPYGCESVRFDDLSGLAAAVAASDAVVLGGGSIFFDYWDSDASAVLTPRHRGVSLWTGLALLAAADEIPVMTYDVGIGPLTTSDGRLMTRAVLELAAVSTVRDSASAALVAGLGLPDTATVVTADPAIRVSRPNDGLGATESGPVLGIAIRQWDTGLDPEVWAGFLAATVDEHLERTGGRAVFVDCHRAVRWPLTDDAAAAAEVIAQMKQADRATTISVDTPWRDRAAILAGCDAVLAMRYHAALFALAAGVPTVGLSYDAKVAGLFTDWGLAGRCLELKDAAEHPHRVVELLADPHSGAGAQDATTVMRTGAEQMRSREHPAAELAAGLLTRSSAAPSGGEAVQELVSRLAASANERPPQLSAALDRLARRIGHPSARRKTVAILTNRLVDRKTGKVQPGGAERYALSIARLLRDLGLDPVFYQGGGSFEVGDFCGFPVHPIEFGDAVSEFQIGIATEFYERTAKADHVLYLMPNYASGPMRADAVVVSHGVWWDHELWPHLQFRTPEWSEQLERVFTQPRRVISVDANTGNVIRALFPEADARIRHIPSAIDTSVFRPPARRQAGEPLVLFPRRAQRIRGSHLVGPILDLVPDPCRFAWIGAGDRDQVAELRAVAARDPRLKVGNATFDQMPKHYAAADICVIPTVASEGQSLSCLEAMASGAAVVVTRVGGLTELVTDGVDGLVCEPTPESLAAAIRRLVRDPALRRRLGTAARSTALRHSEETWRGAWASQLLELGWVDHAAAARAVPYDVVKFSVINWEQRYQRPQQIAAHWARHGRRVFYVRLDRHLDPDGPACRVTPLADRVYEVRLALPPGLRLHHGKQPDGVVPAAVAALDALRAQWNIERAVSLVEFGTWLPIADGARAAFGWPMLYDCMDNWSTFPGFSQRPAVLRAEKELVRSADAMTVSSRAIQEHWAVDRPDAVLIRNAADFDFFHDAAGPSATDRPEAMAAITGPVAGFIGAVVEWFDVELVRQVATARPDVAFVFVGGIARVSVEPLEDLANVHFLGQQPYEDMPAYLRHFDVCLVPFVADDTTASMDLVKVYEYFAQGKPVVCTPVAEMVQYHRYLYLAEGPDEFLAQLDRALAEDDPDAVQRRIELARLNSWDDRIEVLEQLAGAALTGDTSRPGRDGAAAGAGAGDASGDVAKAQAELRAVRAKLDTLNSSRALRTVHKYWAARKAVDRTARRVTQFSRRSRQR